MSKAEIAKNGQVEAAVGYLVRGVSELISSKIDLLVNGAAHLKKEAEIAGILAAATPERLRVVDFTTPIVTTQYCMVQPVPGVINRFFVPVEPFQSLVISSKFYNI